MRNIEENIRKILEKHISSKEYAYFLFGSRAKGNYHKSSDYDVGILGKQKFDFQKFLLLKEALDTHIDYPVDIVDFYNCDTDFKNIALKDIKLWNKPHDLKLV